MAPTTLPPAERPRVTPPWPRSPSCRTRNPHNVVGDVGILSSLGLPGRRVPIKVKVGKSLHRLNFPVLTSSFRPLFDLPDAPSAVPPTSSEWVPGRPVPKPWRF